MQRTATGVVFRLGSSSGTRSVELRRCPTLGDVRPATCAVSSSFGVISGSDSDFGLGVTQDLLNGANQPRENRPSKSGSLLPHRRLWLTSICREHNQRNIRTLVLDLFCNSAAVVIR